MTTAHKTKNAHIGRKGFNGSARDFDDDAVGTQASDVLAADESEIEPVVRKILSEVLTEVSEELGSPDDEPPAEGSPSRMFSGAGAGGPAGTPDGNGTVPPEVSEAVQAVMQELSPEQAESLASLFEAMGEAPGEEEDQETASVGLSSADLQSLERATARGAGGTVVKWVIKWLRTSGKKYLRPAVQAAKRGVGSFMKWKNNLPWAVRIAIGGLSQELVVELVKVLAGQFGAAEGRQIRATGASAGIEPGEPNETEEAVRRVLADMLTKVADELESDEETSQPDEDEPARIERYASLDLESAEAARAEGQRMIHPPQPIGPNHPVVRALRAIRKLYASAVRAAKGGPRSFNRWVNQLSNFNPIKWAIKGLPNGTRASLVAFLARQREGVAAAGRAAAAAEGETEPAEIEQVVRNVLSQVLAGSQSSPAAV